MKLLINGAGGRLGRAIAARASGRVEIVAGVDVVAAQNCAFPVYASLSDVPESAAADVMIDCSFHAAVGDVLAFAARRGLPLIVATTGHTGAEQALIAAAARGQPVFWAANLSLGISVLAELAATAAGLLHANYDIEIIEAHHNQKIDAPSGTALMLADAVDGGLPAPLTRITDRAPLRRPRERREMGIHSVRGGGIAGEHEIIFAGSAEVLRLRHTALSRDLFADGALAAAAYMAGKPAGLYNMKRMIGERLLQEP